MKYSAAAGHCVLLAAAAGSAAAFNLGGYGSLSLPSPSEGWACSSRLPSTHSTVLFARRVPDGEMAERKEQLRNLLGATEIEQLVGHNPNILNRRDIVEAYGPKLILLQKRLGISQNAAGKLCLIAKTLLGLTLETLEGKIDWLQARLDLNKQQLRSIIERRPEALTFSIEAKVGPSIGNIQSGLELSDKELTKMIVNQPDLLLNNFSSIGTIASRTSFLQEFLNVKVGDIATLRKVILRQPNVLEYSEERMLDVQQWLENRFGFGDSKCAQMCRTFPVLLVSRIETLEGKARNAQWIADVSKIAL